MQPVLTFTKKVGDKDTKRKKIPIQRFTQKNQIINHTLLCPACVFKQGEQFLNLICFLTAEGGIEKMADD